MLAALLLGATCCRAQVDSAARIAVNLADGDWATASGTLARFTQNQETRWETLPASLSAFRAGGSMDLWLSVMEPLAEATPNDAQLQFHVGAAWQSLKEIGKADVRLGRALRSEPGNAIFQEFFAWNAAYRFDAEEALRRSAAATFTTADTFRAEQRRRLDAQPVTTLWGSVVCGVLLCGIVFGLVWRAGRGLASP